MKVTRIIGIDPGLVHTGIVEFRFSPAIKQVTIVPAAVLGTNVSHIAAAVLPDSPGEERSVFIEDYRPRSHYSTDAKMSSLVTSLHRAIKGSKVIDNTGVKKVITKSLMKALKVWLFTTKTHHQDLRSAAYIGLYGMVKDDTLNEVLADFVRDFLDGDPWVVDVL